MADQPLTVVPRHGLRREAIVQALIGDIFHGKFSAGQHLVTQELAERFQVSHTPIREALMTLGGIGLLTLQPNRGAVVRELTRRDVRDVCRVRRALECEAVREACGRIDPGLLRSLSREFTKLEGLKGRAGARAVAKARELDSRLHDSIMHAAKNACLTQELGRLKLLFRGLRDNSWDHETTRNDFERLAEEAREHKAIVEGLLAGDRRAAMTAMSRHIMSGITYWTRALPSRDSAAASNGQPPATVTLEALP